MSLISLVPVSQFGLLQEPTMVIPPSNGVAAFTVNPIMFYDSTLGTPTAQGLSPSYTNLPAMIYEINGIAPAYGWNPILGEWL
jgi:hypothetical protein